ncbi:uncharacterized protein V6R79_002405 [Siganus canaliculatus]
MEPHRPTRTASGEHARFHTVAHMAANLRRIFSTFIWIITLVSSSRTRIYPQNEGECGEGIAEKQRETSAPARGEMPLRALRARPRMVESRTNMRQTETA